MKNFLLATMMISSVAFVSCKNNGGTTSENSQDSITVAGEPASEYCSLDRQTYNLRGPVKEVQEYLNDETEPLTILGFDEQGRLCKMTAYSFEGPVQANYKYKDATGFDGEFLELSGVYASLTLTRDENHRITETPHEAFVYDEANRWKEYTEGGWEDATTYKPQSYDKMGNILTENYEGEGEGMEWKGTNTYEYTAFDSHNNWTERKRTDVQQLMDFGEEEATESETTENKYRRTITYYE